MPTGFVKTGFGVSANESDRILNPIVSITIYDQEGHEIGYVTNFEPSTQRRVDRQRHLNAADAGRVVELTHGAEDVSLRVVGFTLYQPGYHGLVSGNLIDRLFRPDSTADAVFTILNKQAIPFDLYVIEEHPITHKGKTVVYQGCKVQSWSGAYQINQAWVAETVSIVVSNVDIVRVTT